MIEEPFAGCTGLESAGFGGVHKADRGGASTDSGELVVLDDWEKMLNDVE